MPTIDWLKRLVSVLSGSLAYACHYLECRRILTAKGHSIADISATRTHLEDPPQLAWHFDPAMDSRYWNDGALPQSLAVREPRADTGKL